MLTDLVTENRSSFRNPRVCGVSGLASDVWARITAGDTDVPLRLVADFPEKSDNCDENYLQSLVQTTTREGFDFECVRIDALHLRFFKNSGDDNK